MNEALLTLIGTATLGISGWALVLLIRMSGKLAGVEMWQEAHDKQDDERHEQNQKDHDDIWTNLKELRGKH